MFHIHPALCLCVRQITDPVYVLHNIQLICAAPFLGNNIKLIDETNGVWLSTQKITAVIKSRLCLLYIIILFSLQHVKSVHFQ